VKWSDLNNVMRQRRNRRVVWGLGYSSPTFRIVNEGYRFVRYPQQFPGTASTMRNCVPQANRRNFQRRDGPLTFRLFNLKTSRILQGSLQLRNTLNQNRSGGFWQKVKPRGSWLSLSPLFKPKLRPEVRWGEWSGIKWGDSGEVK
jgi:hypothetical protein